MARICPITGKTPMVGNHVSHANNKTKRRFLPNLQHRRFWLEGDKVRLRVSGAGLRLIDKLGIKHVWPTQERRPQRWTSHRQRCLAVHEPAGQGQGCSTHAERGP